MAVRFRLVSPEARCLLQQWTMNPEQINALRGAKYNATITSLSKVHSDLMILRIQHDFQRHVHKPGQYNVLGLGYWEPRLPGCQEEKIFPEDQGKLIRRSYSICCPIIEKNGELIDQEQTNWLEYYIALVRQTSNPDKAPALTPRLFMLNVGDRLHMGEKIAGHYTLDSIQPEDSVIFLATGTGEAPHNYMLWQLLRSRHPGKILSVCCVRYQQDLAYKKTHEFLMARNSNYTYFPLTTRDGPPENKVYIQDLIVTGEMERRLGHPIHPNKTHVFLCGNPQMIGVPEKDRETGILRYPTPRGVIEILEKKGLVCDQPHLKIRGNIHFEEYW